MTIPVYRQYGWDKLQDMIIDGTRKDLKLYLINECEYGIEKLAEDSDPDVAEAAKKKLAEYAKDYGYKL